MSDPTTTFHIQSAWTDEIADALPEGQRCAAAIIAALSAGDDGALLELLTALAPPQIAVEDGYDLCHTLLATTQRALIAQALLCADDGGRAEVEEAFATIERCERRLARRAMAQLRSTELEALRLELEQQVAERARELAVFKHLVEHAPDGIMICDSDGFCLYANQACEELLSCEPGTLPGRSSNEYLASDSIALSRELVRGFATQGRWVGEVQYYRAEQVFPAALTAFPLRDGAGRTIGAASIMRDISAQRELEAEQRLLQEQVIAGQQATLRELSTPLINIAHGVVIMPLVGAVDTSRAQAVLESLLTGVSEQRAHTAILDITGVPIVDTQVADALLRAAQAVQLLGARIIITGIRPEIAQTIVGLGVDLRGIATEASLQAALTRALQTG
jgi:rsbT co-antagonist protein RsbR